MAKPATRQSNPNAAPHETGHAALAKHAGSKNTIKFAEEVKVGRLRFFKGMVARFEDPAIAAYFDVAFNGTEFTKDEPNVVIGKDEVSFEPDHSSAEVIDPHTVIGTGRKGIDPGKTIFQHLTGAEGAGDPTLQPHNSSAGSGSEG